MTDVSTITVEEAEKELQKVSFILLDGFYKKEDEEEVESNLFESNEIKEHTQITLLLYHYGLSRCGVLSDEEIYDGVEISTHTSTDGDADNKKPKIAAQIDMERYIPIEVNDFVEYANSMIRESILIMENERLLDALREIDNHVRATSKPVPHIIGTLKETLPEYQ